MKKVLALFLGAVMTLSLSGCCCCLPFAAIPAIFGTTEKAPSVDSDVNTDFDSDYTDEDDSDNNDAELDWGEDATTTTTTTAPAIPDREFAVGSVDGNLYENRLLGLGCGLPGWTYYSNEQLYTLNGEDMNLSAADYAAKMAGKSIFYDMVAVANDSTDNVNVVISKLTEAEKANMDYEQSYANSFPGVQSSLETTGYTDISYEVDYITMGERTYFGVLLTADLGGTPMYQRQFIVRCNEDYIATVTITTLGADTTEEVLSQFYLLY